MRRALLVAVALDALLADPARFHPVAGYGTAMSALERRVWRDARGAGVAYAAAGVAVPALAAALVTRGLRGDHEIRDSRRVLRRARRGRGAVVVGVATEAVVVWACLGGESLARVARRIGRTLETGDVDAARGQVSALVGRDPQSLDADGIARAVVESVAENTSDAAVAPLLWAAVGGVPGVVAYRCANTLDAMVGHRSPRHERFGWAAARLDDLLNLAPARLTAVLACALAPLVGGHPSEAWGAWQRDGSRHPSPNAGPCEAAFAGALGLQLGGTTVYRGVPDERPVLGDGRAPVPSDVTRAVTLSRAVVWSAAVLLALR